MKISMVRLKDGRVSVELKDRGALLRCEIVEVSQTQRALASLVSLARDFGFYGRIEHQQGGKT